MKLILLVFALITNTAYAQFMPGNFPKLKTPQKTTPQPPQKEVEMCQKFKMGSLKIMNNNPKTFQVYIYNLMKFNKSDSSFKLHCPTDTKVYVWGFAQPTDAEKCAADFVIQPSENTQLYEIQQGTYAYKAFLLNNEPYMDNKDAPGLKMSGEIYINACGVAEIIIK